MSGPASSGERARADRPTVGIRIGISGAAGVGKTTLATALAAELGVPCLPEEMRAHLEQTGRPLSELPVVEARQIVTALWRGRAELERTTPSFVADNACLDFAAYALYHGCLEDASWAEPPELLRAPIEHLAGYDAIVLLPAGVLPYVRDGVRSSNASLQLRYQLIIEGLLRRHADPRKVHHLPEGCTAPADRRAWARAIVDKLPAHRARRRPVRGLDPTGVVYLVGAGPGDPGLLTVRACELLRTADVVAHDLLVPPAVLALAGATAELLPVGRRKGGGPTPYQLHPAVFERARAGQSVVRLKAGDPMVFGRGGEEAEALAEAGIRFEIVPGVSSALGAAAYAGIPLTHRLCASDVTFVSGHDAEGPPVSLTDWARLAGGTGTIVMFMAARSLAANLARLIAGGRSPETPAAYVAAATTPAQHVIVGTLATLPGLIANVDPTPPALIIIGEVVRLRERIAWFEHRTLAGRRLVVARARPGRSAIARELRGLGAEVLEVPEVESVALDHAPAAARTTTHDGIVFGCAAGVDAVVARAVPTLPIIAVGTEAQRALARHGLAPAVCVRGACRDALVEHAARFVGRRFLLITSDDGRPALAQVLTALGATVDLEVGYRYVRRSAPAPLPPIDLVVLPSSSAARNLLSGVLGTELCQVPMVAMGPATEAAARDLGARHVVRAADDTPTALVACALSMVGAP